MDFIYANREKILLIVKDNSIRFINLRHGHKKEQVCCIQVFIDNNSNKSIIIHKGSINWQYHNTSITLLFNNKVDRIVINDYDVAIYSIWNAILNEVDKLISLIEDTPISVEEWTKQKKIYTEQNKTYSLELAFATYI